MPYERCKYLSPLAQAWQGPRCKNSASLPAAAFVIPPLDDAAINLRTRQITLVAQSGATLGNTASAMFTYIENDMAGLVNDLPA